MFSLCMDRFNPLQSKEAGKKYSIGAIYMVCLNLPPSLQYQMENVFLVGIIPGPHEPSKEQINYILAPLVDDLLYFFKPGVTYFWMPPHPGGCKIRVILGPLVCDLPAAHQMAGFASHSHMRFCSVCKLVKEDMDELDKLKFQLRQNSEHRQQAKAWMDAGSQAEHN